MDDLGAYEVALGLFYRNSEVAILNKELANDSLYICLNFAVKYSCTAKAAKPNSENSEADGVMGRIVNPTVPTPIGSRAVVWNLEPMSAATTTVEGQQLSPFVPANDCTPGGLGVGSAKLHTT